MAIQQHPLPQDISNYRFRLIGDMTIKQFASLAICIVLAIITYSLPLPFFFKYPFSFVFLLLGIGMAFVPVQGRSLDIWLIAFIKSIYSPTQYIWKRTPASTTGNETGVPTKENNLAITQPVSNDSIQITKNNTSSPTPPPPVSTPTPTTQASIETPIQKEITSSTLPIKESTSEKEIVPAALPDIPITAAVAPKKLTPKTPPPSVNLPIPFTPTTPNTLVGLTLTPTGHILDGVMVEIKKNNLTLRATKSNKLGQFMFARPLDSGLFQILAEKEGSTFSPYSLELTGDIVKPLKIQAQ